MIARFGTMFFTNPVAALRRMRLALKPGGQMTHIVWRRREDNPAWQEAKEIALRHLRLRAKTPILVGQVLSLWVIRRRPPDDEECGLRRHKLLARGQEDHDQNNPEECIAFALAIGPAGEIFREAGRELAEAKRPEIETEMRTYFGSLERDGNGIWAPTSSWIISAHNPA